MFGLYFVSLSLGALGLDDMLKINNNKRSKVAIIFSQIIIGTLTILILIKFSVMNFI